MWIIQKDVLLHLPDDVPLPPNSRVVDVPEDLRRDPRQFRIENGALVRAGYTPRVPDDKLTSDEIRQLKQMLASPATESPSPGNAAPKRAKKKEEK